MATFLCYYRDHYFIWDTTQDAPYTFGMKEAECVEWLRTRSFEKFGRIAELMAKANARGTSSNIVTLKDIHDFNRAGIWEGYLTLDEIYQIYCVEKRWPNETDAQGPRT